MQKRFMIAASLSLALFAGSCPLAGQSPTLSMEEMLAVFSLQFDLTLPDTTFLEMEDGSVWEEASTEAKIMCNAMPAPFERVLQDTSEMTTSPEMTLLEKRALDLNGIPGYLMLMEFAQPAGSGNTEPFMGMMYFRPLDAQTTLTVNVAYPRSQHQRLYPKMLTAFASVRQRPGSKK